jgi:hypothetical protein
MNATQTSMAKPASLIYCPSFEDATLYKAVQKFSDGWPWVRDCCQWVTRDETYVLMEAGQLKPETSYWKVKHYGLICSDHGMTFTGTKDKLLQGISDFVEGWQMALKSKHHSIEAGRLHRPWFDEDLLATPKRTKQIKLGKVSFRM